ncbi:MAG: hypothetical protein HOO67_03405 [Candidatus Peribacteraceae bacterium]|nr:hypothetical protein [Candidatus Peribacteraceae bacterium]
MDKVEKQLRKMPAKDRDRVMDAMEKIILRNFSGLNLKQLTGFKSIFRVRVGNYRIIYFDNGKTIIFESVSRKNETTYNDL